MNTNTGGPAFPIADTYHASGQVQYGTHGMTLLDWYAGQALKLGSAVSRNPQAAAIWSYEIASAMLSEKARREAVVQESSTTDHSPDAAKMAKLEALNRELVEALSGIKLSVDCFCSAAFEMPGASHTRHAPECERARAALTKAKEVA